MRQLKIIPLLLVFLIVLSGCEMPIQIAGNTTPTFLGVPTPLPSFTAGNTTPTFVNVPTPEPSSTAGNITPSAPPPLPTPVDTIAGAPSPTSLPTPTGTATSPSTPSGVLTQAVLENFTYNVEGPDVHIPLKDGKYSGDHLTSTLVQPIAFGDLNGDGLSDAGVILATNMGGTGTFFDLVAVIDQNGTPEQVSYASFGDRQIVKNLQIQNGRVILDYITQGPGDPSCCPNQHRLRSYLLEPNGLHLASEQVLESESAQATPVPDTIIIDQPAMWSKINNPVTVSGRVGQVPPEKKLAYYLTDMQSTLLLQGEVPVDGQPGEAGSFNFQIQVDTSKAGVFSLEIVDSANGLLRGRSVVELLTP